MNEKKRKYLFHFIMTMEIVKNNKGGSKLCFEGYTYTKKSISKTTIQWECSQRKAYVCKGKVTTDSQVARVIRTIEHSHDANLERVEATTLPTRSLECQHPDYVRWLSYQQSV